MKLKLPSPNEILNNKDVLHHSVFKTRNNNMRNSSQPNLIEPRSSAVTKRKNKLQSRRRKSFQFYNETQHQVSTDKSLGFKIFQLDFSKTCNNTRRQAKKKTEPRTPSDFLLCPVTSCNKSFKRESELRIHLRTHTGERPCVCQCGRKFATRSNLQRHQRIHTGEKPYDCPYCCKSFSQSSHRKRHMLIHTRKKIA
eukprot:gb/GECH01010433.1/.p1 GENE.gb/GECH01010433.1/~~gb/GECH01010433.1/.p1  ORF type:complete len:196 (+),score=14.65 gb/GECH01010433.1/:1-588(+)